MSRLVAPLLIIAAACGTPQSPSTPSAQASKSSDITVGNPQGGDSADSACNVVLRFADATLTGRNGPATDCSSGTCWVVINGAFDISRQAEAEGVTPGVLYAGADGVWRTATATRQWNAPFGMLRYGFTLNQNTFTSGADLQQVNLIPFVRTLIGGRAFDHNRVADGGGNYALTADNDWSVQQDGTCPGTPPHGIQTMVFAKGWQQSWYGNLVQTGKIDVNYDIYRQPQGIGCTTDGVEAWDAMAYAQFQPSGAIVQERIDGPLDPTTNLFASIPVEFDVPSDATSVALWFLQSSECQGDFWDSRFGANYVFDVASVP